MRPVSISTALFDGYPMDRALGEIAAGGAKWVEPAFIKGYVAFSEDDFSGGKATALSQAIRREGLGVIAVSAHMDCGGDDAGAMLERRIRFAGTVGARFLVTNAGKRSQEDKVLSNLRAAIPLCASTGVTVALENPGHGSDDLIENAAQGEALIQRIGSERIRLNYDAGNIFTYHRGGIQPAADVTRALPLVSHLHLKDVSDDGEGGWQFTALGDGLIDYQALWEVLPPDLPLGIELPLRLRRPRKQDPMRVADPLPLPVIRTALRRSLEFLIRLQGS